MGTLFSAATGFLIWSLERRHHQVQEAYHQLKEMQDQLIQTEKMASVGRVVAGIVHELNTPLVTMQGYTRILMEGVAKEEAADNIALIHKQAERCHKIVRDLLTYARWDKPKFRKVSLNELLDLSLANMPPAFQQEVEVRKHYPDAHVEIQGDPEQLQRVFLNLFMNSWQAMQEAEMSGRPQMDLTMVRTPQKIQIKVKDNGPGIPKEIQAQIFEPFFTTKPAGKGTGLGLSLSHAILLMHGGNIHVESEATPGTTFKVELPI